MVPSTIFFNFCDINWTSPPLFPNIWSDFRIEGIFSRRFNRTRKTTRQIGSHPPTVQFLYHTRGCPIILLALNVCVCVCVYLTLPLYLSFFSLSFSFSLFLSLSLSVWMLSFFTFNNFLLPLSLSFLVWIDYLITSVSQFMVSDLLRPTV